MPKSSLSTYLLLPAFLALTLLDGPPLSQRAAAASPTVQRVAKAVPSLKADDYGLSLPLVKPKPKTSLGAGTAVAAAGPVAAPAGEPTAETGEPAVTLGPVRPALPKDLTVGLGKFIVIRAVELKSVVIADPEIADVIVLSSQLLLVTGKAAGTTEMVLRDDGFEPEVHTVTVTAEDTLVAADIEKSLGVPGVEVSLIRDSIVLQGEVADEAAVERATSIAKLFADKVLSFLTVKAAPPPPDRSPELAAKIKEALANEAVQVRVMGDTAILSGVVENAEQKQKLEQVAAVYIPNVVSLLETKPITASEIQQMIGKPGIQVEVVRDWIVLRGSVETAEESQEAERLASLTGKQVLNQLELPPPPPPGQADEELAAKVRQAINTPTVTVSAKDGAVSLTGSVKNEREAQRVQRLAMGVVESVNAVLDIDEPSQVRVEVTVLEMGLTDIDDLGFTFPGISDGAGYIFGETAVGSPMVRQTPSTVTVKAMATSNDSRILSRPSATVLSGKEATFQVGGQIPIPSTSYGTQGQGGGVLSQTVEFKDYGILMTVKPTVDQNGNISMALTTEVSEPDYNNAVNISGSVIPGFRSRSSQTEVFVKNGATLALAGLIDRTNTKAISKFPVLGDLPVLGQLFRSTRYQEGKTELVILVTPHTVTAADA